MRWAAIAAVTLLAAGLLPSAAPEPPSAEIDLLKASGLPTDGPGLLGHFRSRFESPLTEAEIGRLIEQLGDDTFERRQEATRRLEQAGRPAKGPLVEALKRPNLDPEIRARATRILRQVGGDGLGVRAQVAAVRVLAARRPADAAALFLRHAVALRAEPFAPAAYDALAALAVRDGKAEPAFAAALADKSPARRHAAAVALLRAGAADQMPALKRLLDDDDRDVRFDAALGLARLRQKEAIAVLIAELDRPVTPRFGQAEELLCRLAGDKSPTLGGADLASRRAYRDEWQAWWKANEASADLAALTGDPKPLGRTLVVLLDDNQVLALEADKSVRWKMEDVRMALDAQPLPGDRALLAEHGARRVAERTAKGKVIWEVPADEPLAAQRLADGRTMIATKDAIVEIDRDGREAFRWVPPPGVEVMRARRLPDGDLVVITQQVNRQLVRLDAYGMERRRFAVAVDTSGGRVDVTPAGHYLIPEMYANRVVEYDENGRPGKMVTVEQPIACVALPGGGLIATSMTQRRAVELDRAGKEVWEYRRDTRVTRAIRY